MIMWLQELEKDLINQTSPTYKWEAYKVYSSLENIIIDVAVHDDWELSLDFHCQRPTILLHYFFINNSTNIGYLQSQICQVGVLSVHPQKESQITKLKSSFLTHSFIQSSLTILLFFCNRLEH